MYTAPATVFAVASAGVVAGILGALLGVGGGVFLIPVLVLVFDVPMHYAVATSIVSVIATSSAVASTNVERGTVNMHLGMVLEIATALGAILGGLTAGWLSVHVLEGLFGLLLVLTAGAMWADKGHETDWAENSHRLPAGLRNPPTQALGVLGGSYYDEGEQQVVVYQVRRPGAALGISCLAGLVSGLLGVGGGIFKVPALHLVCNVPIKAAAATSNFMIGVTAAASAFLYYGRGEVRPALTAATVLGILLGSSTGAALNRRVHAGQLRRLFAVLLAMVALHMLYRACSSP